jgi:endonuclease G
MKKSLTHLALLIGILFLFFGQIAAQSIVNRGIYTVNFSNSLHEPLWVSYKLYKGGGDCNRNAFRFKNDIDSFQTATDFDYAKSGYDKGHLANAEDFAYDCTKDELTFRYYNCLPQTPNLNRGVWKTNETKIRKWSQSDSLLIICGGTFGKKKIGRIAVPDYCWKVVQSLSTKKILFCGWFTNSTKATEQNITFKDLENRTDLKLQLKQ